MRIACDGETLYGLVHTYETEQNFRRRFAQKFKDEFEIDEDFATLCEGKESR